MARYETDVVTTNTESSTITLINPRSGGDSVFKTIGIQGTFGSGTATLEVTIDGGTTWIPFTSAGAAVEYTVNDVRNMRVCSDAKEPIKLRFALTGATTPSIQMIVYDVR